MIVMRFETSPTPEAHLSAASRNAFLVVLLAALLAHWMCSFVLVDNVLSPVHQDDYSILGATWRPMRWFIERPVSTNIARLLGELGGGWAFAAINLLTVLEPAAVAWLVFELLRVRLRLMAAAVFVLLVFAHSSALEHGKFLGLVTNLVSHGFGMAAMALLLADFRRPSPAMRILAAAAYALSAFAKEDFLLPPLLLAAYFGAEIRFPRGAAAPAWTQKHWLQASGMLLGVAAASVAFNALVSNPFVSGSQPLLASAPYAVDLRPASLARSALQLTYGYAWWETAAWQAALAVLALTWRGRRREVLLLAAITVSLILPYAVIPNRIIEYRAFAWLPWFAAAPALVAALAWGAPGGPAVRIAGRLFALAVLAGSAVVASIEHQRLAQVATWYSGAQRLNRNILQTLEDNRSRITSEPVVGVVGVEGLSPWSNSDGAYLGKLGFANRWIVYVNQANGYNSIRESDLTAYVQVSPIARLCARPDLPVVRFRADGTGVLERGSAVCAGGGPAHPSG